MDDDVKTALQFVNDVIAGKYTAAKKENDFVYHEKIPTLDSLPEVKGMLSRIIRDVYLSNITH